MRRGLRVIAGLCALATALSGATARAEPAMGVGRGYSVEATGSGGNPVRLHAEEAGQGEPLVLLHGLGTSTFTWRKVAAGLAARYRVIALDFKGFGQSEKPLDLAYSVAEQAHLVAKFLEKRRLSGVTLVGHSYGGTVALKMALELAERDPGRIRRLVLVASPAYGQSISPFVGLALTPAVPDAIISTLPARTLASTFLTLARNPGSIPEADLDGYAAPLADLGSRHAILTTGRSLILSGELDGMARGYAGLRTPTLILWCRNDQVVPVSTGRRLARDLPRARLAYVRGCNHLPQDEQSDRFLRALLSWLR